MILDGQLRSSSRIEEVEIGERLGVSRTPVREALIALEQEGLVRSRPNRGFIVAPADAALVSEAFPVLGALEAAALRLSGSKLQTAIPDIESLISDLARSTGGAEQYRLDHAFHECLTNRCGNQRLLALLDAERTRARRFDGFIDRGTADREGTGRHHRKIVAEIRKRNYDGAAAALIEHWDWGKEVVLKWFRQKHSRR